MMKSAIFTVFMVSLFISSQGNNSAGCASRNDRCRRRVTRMQRQGYGPARPVTTYVNIACKADKRVNNDIYACAGPVDGLTGTSGNNLCAAGFEVCPSANRCEALRMTTNDCRNIGQAGTFWATRESSAGNLRCNSNGGGGNNDVFGCTSCAARRGILYKNVKCKVLDAALGNLGNWNGWTLKAGGNSVNEKQFIRSTGTNGGVLCCRKAAPAPAPGGYYAAAKDEEEVVDDEEIYDEDEQIDDEESIIYDQQPLEVDYNYKPLAPQTNQLQDATNLMMLAAALAILVLAVSATTYICVSTCKSNKNMAMYQPTKTDDMYD